MKKQDLLLFVGIAAWAYLGIYQLTYYVWPFPLSQNWFTDNGLVIFKDIIYHHTPLPLFILYYSSKLLGNTGEMLQFVSFLMTLLFGVGVYLLGNQFSERAGKITLLFFVISFFALFQNFNLEEMTAALFTLYATLLFIRFLNRGSHKSLFFSGILVGCAIMGKQVTVGIIPSFLIAYLISIRVQKKNIMSFGKAAGSFSTGVVLGILPVIIYFFLHNALGDFLYWNIIFNLTIYPQQSVPYSLRDGLASSFWLYASLIPAAYLLLKIKPGREKNLITVLILNSLFLFPSFLPSFLVYKMLPMYIYPLTLWSLLLKYRERKLFIIFFLIGLIGFIPIGKRFYIDYVPQDIFAGKYLLDYGEDELSVVGWLEKNTGKNEKIMNMGHHYITTLARRLPANRYVYIFPWLVSPFEKSTAEIIESHPRVVIVDTKTMDDWPTLKNWGFYKYTINNYKKTQTFGQYEIYVKNT